MRVVFFLILTAFILSSFNVGNVGQGHGIDFTNDEMCSEPKSVCTKFDFRWLELENVLYSEKVRHIEVFLDERAFSEENLRTLFAFLSKKNPHPQHITAVVYTNWQQLPLPSPDCPGWGMSNMPEKPDRYDYLQAIYYRREAREYFRYSPATKVHDSEFKTVLISKNP